MGQRRWGRSEGLHLSTSRPCLARRWMAWNGKGEDAEKWLRVYSTQEELRQKLA